MDPMRALTREERDRITITHLSDCDPMRDFADDVQAGLSSTPKYLLPKYFYDERGSLLFDRICGTPEYYLTRTEDSLLADIADGLIERVRPETILELGSGASRKTVRLLQACDRQRCHVRYLPLDVCAEMLLDAARRLTREYGWLEIEALVGDYCSDLGQIPRGDGTRLFPFLGSTIGNFDSHETARFLRTVRIMMEDRDWLLLGADRVKDVNVLNAAYNDTAGLTADFNLNALEVINRELAGEFDLHSFHHHAWYNDAQARIEMHIRSKTAQVVRIGELDQSVAFAPGESILTEISRKFTLASLDQMLVDGGFVAEQHFQPQNRYFSLVLARPHG
ncbi:MAG: L-histidine N(alpha)-methyltransferase [Acidiferrobacterales bacterium]